MMLQPMAELTILFPAAFACFLATAEHLRGSKRALALLVIPVLTAVCVLGGALCWRMNWPTNYLILPILVPAAVAFCRRVELPVWKSISIFLGVCGAMSSIGGLAIIADALLFPDNADSLWLTPAGGLIDCAMGWVLVALCWYPVTHAARRLLKTETVVRTWYVFWILPAVFVLVNLVVRSQLDALLYSGQLLAMYALLSLVMTGLLLLFYLLFYVVARELAANTALQRENQFLHMQTAQYTTLRESIAETRRARHDMRHHFGALSALAQREAWEELRDYLADVSASIPADGLTLCENQAVDGVAGRYAALCRQNGVAFSCKLELPVVLPVKEMDVCVVLQNLLENALEASQKLGHGGYVRLQGSLHGDRLVLLTVENTYAGALVEKDGTLQSTKPNGGGIGLESVAHIAEKDGGYCRFLYGDGVFTANVMLRADDLDGAGSG